MALGDKIVNLEDLKVVGDAVGNLKSGINPLYRTVPLDLVANSYWPTTGDNAGKPRAYTGWSRTPRIACTSGETLYISTTVASAYNVFFDTDTDGDVNSSFSLAQGNNTITVPAGAYYFGLSNTTSGMENTTVKMIVHGDELTTLQTEVDGLESDVDAVENDVDAINGYIGITSNEKVVTISSLVESSSSRRRTDYMPAVTLLNAITVNAISGYRHNINFYKATTSDGTAEAGWQSDTTTFVKPDDTYHYWWVNFSKSDNSDFSAADTAALLSALQIKEVYKTFDKYDTVYVATTGSDSNDGSKTSPFQTLQKAVDSGALTVRAAAGTYTGFKAIARKTPLTIMLDGMPASYSTGTAEAPKIKITTGIASLGYGVYASGCTSISLSDIWVDGMAADCFRFDDVGSVYCERCYASDNDETDNSMGFRINNCNGTFKDCKAWDINKDGFNIHKYGNTEFINCVAHDCGDDGISHHDGCTGLILGGEYYNCYKGGISSPYGGAIIDIHNAYVHDNTLYGIYSMSSNEMLKSSGKISNCAIVSNGSYDIIASYTDLVGWNNVYGTKSIGTQATFTEITGT